MKNKWQINSLIIYWANRYDLSVEQRLECIKELLEGCKTLEFPMNDVEFQEMMNVINRISKKDVPATLVDVCRLLEMQGILLVRILKTIDDIHESK